MSVAQLLTVAKLRPVSGGDDVEVMFLESSRIYLVRGAVQNRNRIIALLRDALKHRRRVSVTLSSTRSAEIVDVHVP